MTSEDDDDKAKFLSGVSGRFTSSPLETATPAWHEPPPDDYEDETYDEPPGESPPPQVEFIPPIWFYEDAFYDGSTQVPPPASDNRRCPPDQHQQITFPSRINSSYQAIEEAMREAARSFEELGVDPVGYLAVLLQEICLTGRDDYGEVSLPPSICADPLRFAIAVAEATQVDGSNEPFAGRLPLQLSWCE